MSERFGEAAARLCAVAASLLGWRPNDFWNATPAELSTALMPPTEPFELVEPEQIAALRQRFPDEQESNEHG